MTLAFLSLGFGEMLVIGLVALLVFGGNLPEVMRNMGQAYAKFKAGMQDIAAPIREEMRQLDRATPPAPPKPAPEPAATQEPLVGDDALSVPEADEAEPMGTKVTQVTDESVDPVADNPPSA